MTPTSKRLLDPARFWSAVDAGNTDLKRDMTASLSGIGDALLNSGDKEKALAAYEEGVALVRELVGTDANNLSWQRDLSNQSQPRRRRETRLRRQQPAPSPATTRASPFAAAWPTPTPNNIQWRADETYVLQRHRRSSKRSTGDNQGALAAFEAKA